ncbi:MAG: hypothetical protein Q9220_007339 [cf. Caloplaca sp. 1 TL-2023]
MLFLPSFFCLFPILSFVQAIIPIPTRTVSVSAAEATEGNLQIEDDVCPDYKTCSSKGIALWRSLQDKISQAQPVDRTEGAALFSTYYGTEFVTKGELALNVRKDLADHGFDYDNMYAFVSFSKDPETGEENPENAYRNIFGTASGVLIADENFRDVDEQKKLTWSEIIYQSWDVASRYAEGLKSYRPEEPGGGPISNLRTVVQHKVTNAKTKAVLQTIFDTEKWEYNTLDPTWYQFTLANDPNWFYAILGTDNVKGTAFLLTDHAAEIGKKTITDIWVRWRIVDPDVSLGPRLMRRRKTDVGV